MNVRAWLRKLACLRQKPAVAWRTRRRTCLRLERLEDRLVPALVINPTFAANIQADPRAASIESTINQAIGKFEADIASSITVNITFQEMTGGFGLNHSNAVLETYSSYLAALKAHATSTAHATALAHLPAGPDNPVTGGTMMYLKDPLARALGFSAPATMDSTISLNTSAIFGDDADLLAVVLHEMDEAFGGGSDLDGLAQNASPRTTIEPLDLYRYRAAGVRSYNTKFSTSAYFSIDGGATDLVNFNQYAGGDFGDWSSYPNGPPYPFGPEVQDAFTSDGTIPTFGVELERLNVLGFRLTTPTVTAVSPSAGAAAGGDTVTITGTNLDDATAVSFGAVSVPSYEFEQVTSTSIMLNTPPAAAGAVDVQVVTWGGVSPVNVPLDQFTFSPFPTVQFSVAGETVSETAGTFTIEVTRAGTPMPAANPFVSAIDIPTALAINAGNLYVADLESSSVYKVTPAGVVSTFATGFSEPAGLAFDSSGNLYVANTNKGTVSEVTAGGTVSTFASGFSSPIGLAFDAAGNLYVADTGNNTVSKVTPAGVVSTFAAGFNQPVGLAFDAAGNLFVANYTNNTVDKVTPAGMIGTFASNLGQPQYLAFDSAGNLYVGCDSNNTVVEVTPAGLVSTYVTGIYFPRGLAFDPSGNLDVASAEGGVRQITRSIVVPFTLGGSATAGVDYSGVTASPLVIPADQTNGTITVTLLDDPGSSRTLTCTLGTPTGANLGSTSVKTLTIAEPPPGEVSAQLTVDSETVNESAGTFSIPVTLSRAVGSDVSVPFTLGGSAMLGTDYSGLPASPLVIPAGQTSAVITGTLLSDPGPSQTLTITLGTPTGADLGGPSVNTLTIAEPPAAPDVTTVTPSVPTITGAQVGSNGFALTVAYSKPMNTSVAPTIQISSAAGTVTFASGSWNATDTIYTALYNIADAKVTVADCAVTISGGQSADGYAQVPFGPANLLGINMQAPVVLSATSSAATITAAQVGGRFKLTLLFNQAMKTSVKPVIAFSPVSAGSILTFVSGIWSSTRRVYTASYKVIGPGTLIAGVGITVSGAENAAGNAQIPYSQNDLFAIDTVVPTVVSITPSVSVITDAQLGSAGFTLAIQYSTAMNANILPTVKLGRSAATTLSLAGQSWDGTHTVFTLTYNVADAFVSLPATVTVWGAQDIHGNVQARKTGTFAIDTVKPTVESV